MDIFLKGVGLGFAVAAPVGPIGILCVRQTLRSGRRAGLAAGLGAASADAVYGFMVAAGLAATGWLLRYAVPLQVVGGLLLIGLGLQSLRAFWAPSAHSDSIELTGSGANAFGTTFVLTLSNPMTVVAFIGLIAGLGTTTADDPAAAYWLVTGVFGGSALWWLLLVQGAATARRFMTHASWRWLDCASGLVMLICGLSVAGHVVTTLLQSKGAGL